jgi:HEAT repeat protein
MQKTARLAPSIEEKIMLNHDAMRQLRQAYDPYSPLTERDVLARLGNPSRQAIVDAALAGLTSDDRNVRVLMLRVLAGQSGPEAMRGILAGLNDPKRRVREVAIKSSASFHDYAEITDWLKAMVADEHETSRIRRLALDSLAGGPEPLVGNLTAGDAQALESLARIDAYRSEILFGLLRLDLTERVEELLREFVKNGTREEAVTATRALCGYRVVNLGQFEGHDMVQRYVTENCEIAAGRVCYWVRRDHYAALVSGRVPGGES